MLDPKVAGDAAVPHDLIHVDGVSPIPGKDTMDNQFFAGQVAMITRGHWIVQNAKHAKLNMDIADAAAEGNRQHRDRLRRLWRLQDQPRTRSSPRRWSPS